MNFEVKQEPIENSSEYLLTENNNMAAEVYMENVEQGKKTDIPIKIEKIEQLQTNTLIGEENSNIDSGVYMENVEQDIKTDIPIKIEKIKQLHTNIPIEESNIEQVRTDIQNNDSEY